MDSLALKHFKRKSDFISGRFEHHRFVAARIQPRFHIKENKSLVMEEVSPIERAIWELQRYQDKGRTRKQPIKVYNPY